MFDLCKFFQIHTRKGKRDLHFHPRLAIHLRISESVVLFSCSKDSLYCFFSVRIEILHSFCVPYILTFFHVIFPDMTSYKLYMVFTECALLEIWTAFTDLSAALVFPISITICCWILQYLIIRAYITVIVFVVCVLRFLKESFLCHWTLVWEKWFDAIIYEEFCYGRCLIACVCNDSFNTNILDLIV